MVSEDVISYVINKCLSLSRIHEKLSLLSDDEKLDLLKDKTNPFELEDYQNNIKKLNNLKYIKDKKQVLIYDSIDDDIKKYEDEIFQYERRIYDGYEPRVNEDVPSYNLKDFHKDAIRIDIGIYGTVDLGEIEEIQINNQQDITWSKKEMTSLSMWHGDEYEFINGSIYGTNRWNDFLKEVNDDDPSMYDTVIQDMNNTKRHITNSINKTNGLLQPTVLYYGASHFDIHKIVGDKISFDGYISSTFSEHTGKHYQDNYLGEGFLYKFLAPTGTKGICMNSKDLYMFGWEHEYLLGRNTSGTIVDIDYNNREITVLLD